MLTDDRWVREFFEKLGDESIISIPETHIKNRLWRVLGCPQDRQKLRFVLDQIRFYFKSGSSRFVLDVDWLLIKDHFGKNNHWDQIVKDITNKGKKGAVKSNAQSAGGKQAS